jgi:3-oxoacyl-[acyl-carrier-protein] synthase III
MKCENINECCDGKLMKAYIDDIEYFVPDNKLSNEDISAINPDWNVDRIYDKTGISNRYIVNTDQTATDLAVGAAEKLLDKKPNLKDEIDYIILCTQSSDYFLPSSACLIQERLGLRQNSGAIDVNQGCSGFVYSIGLAKGLIETNQAKIVLVITSDTYSKYINAKDKSVKTLFGDAAACTLIRGVADTDSSYEFISNPVYGTNGKGAKNLIVPHGGARNPISDESFREEKDDSNNIRSQANLFMNGREIYTFTLTAVPVVFNEILEKEGMTLDDIDVVIFHQANKFILDTLQKKLKIPEEKMHRSYEDYGNTVSSTIPIGLKKELSKSNNSEIGGSKTALLLGFGVGLSWAGNVVKY